MSVEARTLGKGGRKVPWMFRLYGVRSRTRVVLQVACLVFGLYIMLPVYWDVVAATKTNNAIVNSFGFWFSGRFELWHNIREVFTYNNGEFAHWMLNTVFYAVASGVAAVLSGSAAGFAFAKYGFAGKRFLIGFIIGAVAVPATALVIPLYLLLGFFHLLNNPLGMILPSIGSAFGTFLIYVYARTAVSNDLLDAGRIDGSSESGLLWRIGIPIMWPACVSVLLFTVVGTWNNYFLPLLLFSRSGLYPLSVGLAEWNSSVQTGAYAQVLYALLVAGSLVSTLPTVVAFALLQRYWKAGLMVGSTTG